MAGAGGCESSKGEDYGRPGSTPRTYPQGDEELLGVGADGGDVDADVLAELAQRLPQVHLQGLEDQHHVVAVLWERTEGRGGGMGE